MKLSIIIPAYNCEKNDKKLHFKHIKQRNSWN